VVKLYKVWLWPKTICILFWNRGSTTTDLFYSSSLKSRMATIHHHPLSPIGKRQRRCVRQLAERLVKKSNLWLRMGRDVDTKGTDQGKKVGSLRSPECYDGICSSRSHICKGFFLKGIIYSSHFEWSRAHKCYELFFLSAIPTEEARKICTQLWK
jgi:hypothetical protein